jgi:hypothetical protein
MKHKNTTDVRTRSSACKLPGIPVGRKEEIATCTCRLQADLLKACQARVGEERSSHLLRPFIANQVIIEAVGVSTSRESI